MNKENIITEAVNANKPKLLADFTGKTIDEIVDSLDGCLANNFPSISKLGCCGLECIVCPFDGHENNISDVIKWLKKEDK